MLIIYIISFMLIICIICVTNRKRLLEKNYYEAYEKNRLKSLDKYKSDLTKIYMVNPNMNSP